MHWRLISCANNEDDFEIPRRHITMGSTFPSKHMLKCKVCRDTDEKIVHSLYINCVYHSDITWVSWCLKSLKIDCFVNRFSGQQQRKHQSSTLLDFEKGIPWCSVDYPHKVPFKRNVTMNHVTRVCGWKTNYRHMLKLLRTTVIYWFSGNLQQTITYNSFTWLCELHHVFTVQYVLKMWWKCLKSFW